MKLFMSLLFATLALNGVLSLPARIEDAEVIGGPRRISTRADGDDDGDDDDFVNFKGVIDTGSGYPFLQPNPVLRVGFFDSFDDLFRRFSARVFPTGFFGRAGDEGDDSGEEDDITKIGFPTLDTTKANTTSTVKVVDGHKVEVNETTYGDDNSVFKLRVVNIRPLEEGETVNETETKDIKPVTEGPHATNNENDNNNESNEADERREPLEKKPSENEIQGNIDDPEKQQTIAKKEDIVETTKEAETVTEISDIETTTMLPTTEDINAEFVTENSIAEQQQQQQQQQEEVAVLAEEELNGANGNGNNEFETNMSEDTSNNDNNENNNDNDDFDNIDNVENPEEVEHTIENNEDTEEEINDNLNESSSSSNNANDAADKEQENNDDNENENEEDENEPDAAPADVEIVNLKKMQNSNYFAAIRHKEREDESSSDDEDATAVMHPTFNDEWGNLNNEPTNEQNDLNNEIDVYDVVPIDLSNDIAVNDAADLPLNPDAEFIDVYGVQHQSNAMPKFEKLSLDYQPPSAEEEGDDWSNVPAK